MDHRSTGERNDTDTDGNVIVAAFDPSTRAAAASADALYQVASDGTLALVLQPQAEVSGPASYDNGGRVYITTSSGVYIRQDGVWGPWGNTGPGERGRPCSGISLRWSTARSVCRTVSNATSVSLRTPLPASAERDASARETRLPTMLDSIALSDEWPVSSEARCLL